MRNEYGTQEFKQIQAHWYQALECLGFEDIEKQQAENDGRWSRSKKNVPGWRKDEIGIDTTKAFYDLAAEFLDRFEFKSDLQKSIWNYYAHGFSLRKIGRIVGKDKDHVHLVITTLKTIMLKL